MECIACVFHLLALASACQIPTFALSNCKVPTSRGTWSPRPTTIEMYDMLKELSMDSRTSKRRYQTFASSPNQFLV